MKKKILPIIAIAATILFGACSSEDIIQEVTPETTPEVEAVEEERVITLTASMPEEPNTRVNLVEKDSKAIELTWEVGDTIHFAFIHETTGEKIRRKYGIVEADISADGKKTNIVIPTPIAEGKFDFFATIGGDGIDFNDPAIAKLPIGVHNAKSLEDVKNRGDVMLYAEARGIDVDNMPETITFKHLGSLYSITLKNVGTEKLSDLNQVRISSANGEADWLYSYGAAATTGTFNLIEGEFVGAPDAKRGWIPFTPVKKELLSRESITVWSWYPVLPDVTWPALNLVLKATDGSDIAKTTTAKPARESSQKPGKRYMFNAEYNNGVLEFVD